MLEITAAYSENHTKPISAFRVQNAELIIDAVGTHTYHLALNG
jgi:hypothetical protein